MNVRCYTLLGVTVVTLMNIQNPAVAARAVQHCNIGTIFK